MGLVKDVQAQLKEICLKVHLLTSASTQGFSQESLFILINYRVFINI